MSNKRSRSAQRPITLKGAQTDGRSAPRVAIVSESVARTLAGGDGRGALGTEFQILRDRRLPNAEPVVVVGIAEDVRYNGPRAERTTDHDIYIPMAQAPNPIMSIAVVTDRDPDPLLPAMQRTLGRLAPTSPLHWISTMDDEMALQFGDARLYAWLTGVFGSSALLLVMLGIYGVISNAVTRRWTELGIRMAVGAQPREILLLVLQQASRPMVLGVAAGAIGSLALATLASSLVYGMAPNDPVTFAAVGAILLATGLAACFLPARRATRLDPKDVLQAR